MAGMDEYGNVIDDSQTSDSVYGEDVREVDGFVDHIIFRNAENGYTVFNIIFRGKEVTCVGLISYMNEGEYIHAQGSYVTHPVYWKQFKITSYSIDVPQDEEAVRHYLGSGAIKGIGEKTAESIVNYFGSDTFRIMEEEPERLAEIKGISMKKAMDIANQIVSRKDMRKAIMFLQNYGISMNLSTKIYEKYGDKIYSIIQDNPYKMAEDIEGIGFRIADEIAQKVGIHSDSVFRIRSGIFYVLLQATSNGHVFLPMEELIRQTKELLLVDIAEPEQMLVELAIEKKIVIKDYWDTKQNAKIQIVYAANYYYTELKVAARLAELDCKYEVSESDLTNSIQQIEKKEGITLEEHQRQATIDAAKHGLMVVTGGPGTGKTTTINTIIHYFESEGLEIRLAAPTGRAAKRMSETTGYEAQTIHRLLEINGGMADGSAEGGMERMHFEKNEMNPLEADVVIIDEMSMVDINLMCALLAAVEPGTRLILVGDVDQLPSVGAGNVLRDIIQSGCFNVVKLTKIFRQAQESEIVTNAHIINRGEPVALNKFSKDFLFIHRNSPDAIIGAISTLIKEKLPDYVHADINEIQILTPMRKGVIGVEKLNQVLQNYLNPPDKSKAEREYGGTVYRVGDKVMQVRNNYQLEWEKRSRYGIPYDGGSGIFNGDMGVITSMNTFSEELEVMFDEERYVTYPFKQLEELELAYAVTIHKSQGSEYPAVIIPMFAGPRMLMTRNLLYTAVTRAKTCVCLVGNESCFQEMIRNENEQRRYSALDVRIQECVHKES